MPALGGQFSQGLSYSSGLSNNCGTPAGGSSAFPQTVSGTTTSGGIPYFSNTTTLTSSGLLATNALMSVNERFGRITDDGEW